MVVSTCLSNFVTLTLVPIVFAAIGPVTDLSIANAVIAPDGYSRSYVILPLIIPNFNHRCFRAVLADGQFPGPLIKGNKAFTNI
jgi:iron transport multicopper oxidase